MSKRGWYMLINWMVLLSLPIWGGLLLVAIFIVEWCKGDYDCKRIVSGKVLIGVDL